MPVEPDDPIRPVGVYQRGEKPPGILPRNTQAKLLGGIAVLMVLALAFSGTSPTKGGKPAEPPPSPPAMDVNQARIQEYRARIEEQTRKLAVEQAQLAQTKQALGLGAQAQPSSSPAYGSGGIGSRSTDPVLASAAPERNWKAEEKERLYESLFASNVALSYRSETKPNADRGLPAVAPPSLSSGRRDIQESSALASGASGHSAIRSSQIATTGEVGAEAEKTPEGKHRVMEGTMIETVLTNRLDGEFAGPVNCLVTTSVYSRDRRKVLIPQGSRVLGEAQRVESFGQKRLAVVFHRLILPNGNWFSLEKFKGLNQLGETGLRDRVNNHYLQVFGVSAALGMLAGFSQANTRSGFDASGEDAYRQGVANSLSQSSLRILDRYLNVLPTFTIREGHRVKVYLAEDLLLPAYSSVDEPSPL